MDLLSQWEADAQKKSIRIPCPDGMAGCCVMHLSMELYDTPENKRIRALIELIRKKDEVLKHGCAAMTYAYEDHVDQYYLNVLKDFQKALALTEQLKKENPK